MIATLKQKSELCPGTWEFIFQLSESHQFTAGQYIFVKLASLEKEDPRGPRRHFSIVNSPLVSDEVTIATRIRDTGFKQTLNYLPIGATVDISKPYGDFILPQETNQPLVFIAGGIGITPFMSMLRFIQESQMSFPSITLLYSNKNSHTAAFLHELTEFQNTIPNFHLVATMTQDEKWEGEKGRIDLEKLQKYVPDVKSALFYVVGPEMMNQAVEDILVSLHVPDDHIKREDFTGY